MPPYRPQRSPRPLDERALEEMALRYVGRFATTRAKLRTYLARKLRERGWSGAREPDLAALAERLASLGYVDDAAYALGKSRALTGRGYGKRRLVAQLGAAGVEEEHRSAACDHADEQAVAAALRFAERRRIGPFASAPPADRTVREKAIGAMLRAGHSLALARAIVALDPGAAVSVHDLAGQLCIDAN